MAEELVAEFGLDIVVDAVVDTGSQVEPLLLEVEISDELSGYVEAVVLLQGGDEAVEGLFVSLLVLITLWVLDLKLDSLAE